MSSAYISIKEEKDYNTFEEEEQNEYNHNKNNKFKIRIKIILILLLIIIIFVIINNYYINPIISNCNINHKKIKKNDSCYKKMDVICNDDMCTEVDSCPIDCGSARILLSVVFFIAEIGFLLILFGLYNIICNKKN
jgi:hypothetical protein